MKNQVPKLTHEAKSLWEEFKTFAFKGNLIDLAIAVVIGKAFGDLVQSLVNNVIMPLVTWFTPQQGYENWKLGRVLIGKFLGDTVSFLIVSLAVFIVMVKLLGALRKHFSREEEHKDPTNKKCPRCLSDIPIKATKCAYCTVDLPEANATTVLR